VVFKAEVDRALLHSPHK